MKPENHISFCRFIIPLMILLLTASALVSQVVSGENGKKTDLHLKKWRILHIMSYHSPWEWTDSQLSGFKDALSGLNVEYKVFQMDTKRRSSEKWKQEAGKQARRLIDSWKPDLVYTDDDDAQIYVAKYYINSKLPFVFSAVNADPRIYGFVGSKNMTGVMEIEHSVESFTLLKELVPTVKTVVVITDGDPMWPPVIQRMKGKFGRIKGVSLIFLDPITSFSEYQRKIGEFQTKADALALLGIFSFKDNAGKNVPYQEVLHWTAKNSRLPDFSFWKDRVSFGTLCVVSVSGYAQGMEAGKIAHQILVEGKSPSEFPMKPTIKGEPLISLARAKSLGIQVKSRVLLSSKVITTYEWDK